MKKSYVYVVVAKDGLSLAFRGVVGVFSTRARAEEKQSEKIRLAKREEHPLKYSVWEFELDKR